MNEQKIQHNSSGGAVPNSLNTTLITMQIQALRQSLQRLVEQDDEIDVELFGSENQKIQPNSNC